MNGQRLKEVREERGLSQRELEALTGISHAVMSQWENNKICPTIDSIVKLADFYRISIDELIGREVER